MPRKTVAEFYAQFETARAALDTHSYPHDGTNERKWNAAVDVASELCRRIVTTPANPANPIPDLLLKIAAAAWWDDLPKSLDECTRFSSFEPNSQTCILSIRADLQHMQEGPPRRGAKRAARPARSAVVI